jgi:hypothetical protein
MSDGPDSIRILAIKSVFCEINPPEAKLFGRDGGGG